MSDFEMNSNIDVLEKNLSLGYRRAAWLTPDGQMFIIEKTDTGYATGAVRSDTLPELLDLVCEKS